MQVLEVTTLYVQGIYLEAHALQALTGMEMPEGEFPCCLGMYV